MVETRGEHDERRQLCTGSCPEHRFSPAELFSPVPLVMAGRGRGGVP